MTEEKTPKKRRNWTKIALIGSLALNLLVVGLVMGAVARIDKGGRVPLDRASMGLGIFIAALPDEQKAGVHAAAGPASKNRRAFFKELRARHRQLEAAIVATPFSEEQVRAALREHRSFAFGSTEKVQEAYVDALAELSADERAAYFTRVEETRESRKKRRKQRRRDKD